MAGALAVVHAFLLRSEPMHLLRRAVNDSAAAIEFLGAPADVTGIPSGSFEVDTVGGNAEFSIGVKGSRGHGTAYAHAVKELGVWRLARAELAVPERSDRIDLLGPPSGEDARGSWSALDDATAATVREAKRLLESTRPNWVSFRRYAGRNLVYFTHLVSYRGGLAEIRYSLDDDSLSKVFPFTPSERLVAPIESGTEIYIAVPDGTAFVAVQLTFKDGHRSAIERFRSTTGAEG